MNRDFLELVAAAVNINSANYPNDSKFEQAIRYKLETLTASGAATTLQPAAKNVARAGGYGKNV